jgi:hypothetical protein
VLGPLGSTDTTATTASDDQESDEDKKKDKDSDDESVDVWLGLINAGPVNLEQQIEEPVTSGSDINFDVGQPDGSN